MSFRRKPRMRPAWFGSACMAWVSNLLSLQVRLNHYVNISIPYSPSRMKKKCRFIVVEFISYLSAFERDVGSSFVLGRPIRVRIRHIDRPVLRSPEGSASTAISGVSVPLGRAAQQKVHQRHAFRRLVQWLG
jgi:hypothetical protein